MSSVLKSKKFSSEGRFLSRTLLVLALISDTRPENSSSVDTVTVVASTFSDSRQTNLSSFSPGAKGLKWWMVVILKFGTTLPPRVPPPPFLVSPPGTKMAPGMCSALFSQTLKAPFGSGAFRIFWNANWRSTASSGSKNDSRCSQWSSNERSQETMLRG